MLTVGSLHLWSKLAFDVSSSRKVGEEMKENENNATLEIQKYIEAAAWLWDVFSSKEPGNSR